MDQLNTKANKMEKIKVRIDSSNDSIIQQLKEQLNDTKIQLSIKHSPSGNEILKSICPLLSSFNNLLSLSFKLDNEFNLELSPFLVALKQLKSLEQLTIFLNQEWLINQESELGIGEAIEDSVNLKQLNLTINGKNLSHKVNLLSLENAYKKLKNMENLELQLNYIHIPQQLACIFIGLRNSQNLSVLKIKLSECSFSSLNIGYKIFCEELKEIKGLKQFDLQDENYYLWEEENCQINFGTCIKFLENLEKLSLNIPLNRNEQNPCIEGIQQLKFLKEITIGRYFESMIQLKNYCNIIAQCQNLESVNLFNQQYNSKLSLMSSLQQIKNITKLEIKTYYSRISLNDTINFILSLKNHKKLVHLSLDYFDIRQNQDEINPTLLEECRNYIKNIESFQVRDNIMSDQIHGHVLLSFLWFPLLSSIPTLKKMKINCISTSVAAQQKLMNLDELIINKKDLITLQLEFDATFRIEQNNFLKFFQQLSMNVNLGILDLNFTKMLGLDFDDNILKELGNAIVKCNKLTVLNILFGKDNNFSSQGVKMLNQGLKQLQELNILHLSLNKIHMPSNNIEILFKSIKNLKSLKKLYFKHKIQFNNQEGKGINGYVELPVSLKTISIEIKGYKYKYENIRGLVQGISDLNKLSYLCLKIKVFEFQQQELLDLQRVLVNLKNLNRMTINFKSLLSLNLFQLFSDLQLLEDLTLYSKIKRDYYQTSFFKIKKNNSKGNNKFTQQDNNIELNFNHKGKLSEYDVNILNDFFQNSKLESLYLRITQENEMDAKGLSKQFFSSFQYLTNLRKLSLDFEQENRIICENFIFIGKEIQNLIHLKELEITLDIQDYQQENNYPLDQLIGKLKHLSNLHKIQFKTKKSSLKELHQFLIGISNLSNLNSLTIDVTDVTIDNEEFYKFKSQEYLNLYQLKINLFEKQNIESISQFLKSTKNLQNLRILEIHPDYCQLNYLFKILRLVQIVQIV